MLQQRNAHCARTSFSMLFLVDMTMLRYCKLRSAPFHPLTNRKHHCRLCGQIICSLPIKSPQRPVLCSTLFVVDSVTRHIEEVGEGVDYGVKKRQVGTPGGQHGRQEDEEKFLKGVRICRDCRPILLCVILDVVLKANVQSKSGVNNIISKPPLLPRLSSFMRHGLTHLFL